jgi:hypothetical protein
MSELDQNPQPQSINHFTRAVRRKLYFLLAMLALVIILMKEARKPENWMWMGFPEKPSSSETIELNGVIEPESFSDQLNNQAEGSLTDSLSETSNGSAESSILPEDSEASAFWDGIWETLETEDRTALVELIQLSQKPVDQRDVNLADFDPLVSALNYNSPDEGAYLETWESTIQPGLLAVAGGKDLTINQQVAIKKLFQFLDPLIMKGLDDFTSPGRKVDMPAWFRYWGRILEKENTEAATPVSPVQLVAQPNAWRFQPIRVKGRLLAGRAKKAGIHGPLRHREVWYEWWIGNTHGANEVWCVYTASKPDSIEVGEKFSNFDIAVESSGLFYKIRSYIDAESKGSHCPLILSDDLTVIQKSNPIARATWIPSPVVMISCIVGVMVLAFAVAMLVNRGDKHRVYQPGGEHKKLIDSHLSSLGDDPDIKTVAERLEELE